MTNGRKVQPGRFVAAIAGAIMAAATFGSVHAADFPDRDITFIVPYSPGGGSDLQARRLLPGMKEALGVNIQIVYKTGGAGAVGFLELHSSKPDGYTISNVVVPNIISGSMGKDVGYKPDDFSYVAMTVAAVGSFVVPRQSEFQTLEEVIAFAKENPGELTVAGVGQTGRANFALFVDVFDIEATYIPVSGGVGKVIPLLQGGHVHSSVLSSTHTKRHLESLRPLVIAGDESPALPNVPTAASLGYPDFHFATYWGIMAPPGTPAEVVSILNDAVHKATADPAVRKMQVDAGLTPLRMTPEETRDVVMSNIAGVAKKLKLADDLGLK